MIVVQVMSFIHSEFDHFFGAWSEANFTKNNAISTSNHKLNGRTEQVQVHAEVAQYFDSNPFSLTYKTEQEMFGANVVMLKSLGFFLSEIQDLPGPLGELLKSVPVLRALFLPTFFAINPPLCHPPPAPVLAEAFRLPSSYG